MAIDTARTLLRLGAEPVVLYRRGREEMPALKEEVEKAVEEGIEIQFLTLPVAASKKGGRIALTCTKMKLGAPDESGRPRPEPVPGSEFTLEFYAVMEALGEEPDLSIVPEKVPEARGELKDRRVDLPFGRQPVRRGRFRQRAVDGRPGHRLRQEGRRRHRYIPGRRGKTRPPSSAAGRPRIGSIAPISARPAGPPPRSSRSKNV